MLPNLCLKFYLFLFPVFNLLCRYNDVVHGGSPPRVAFIDKIGYLKKGASGIRSRVSQVASLGAQPLDYRTFSQRRERGLPTISFPPFFLSTLYISAYQAMID